MIYTIVMATATFLAGGCSVMALATHELNEDFRRFSWLMMAIFLGGAGLMAFMLGYHGC